MGDQPIYTAKAHIFQIDASNKKQWVPLSSTAVFVQFVYESQKNVGRIISADNAKPILNSVIHSNVSFLKTSQKFGQWADPKAVTVYGVGFATESDLNRFADKFRDLREMVTNKTTYNGNGEAVSVRSNSTTSAFSYGQQTAGSGWRLSTSVSMGAVSKPHSTTFSLSSSPSETQIVGKTASDLSNNSNANSMNHIQQPGIEQNSMSERNVNVSTNGTPNAVGNGTPLSVNSQLTYNRQLELEIGALRIENNRLVNALKDATENTEEWKRKSSDYREEVHRLRKKISELEVTASEHNKRESTAIDDLQRLLHTYKAKLTKSDEEQRHLNERLQMASSERDSFQQKYDELLGSHVSAKQDLVQLHHSVLDKAEEMTSLANKLGNIL